MNTASTRATGDEPKLSRDQQETGDAAEVAITTALGAQPARFSRSEMSSDDVWTPHSARSWPPQRR